MLKILFMPFFTSKTLAGYNRKINIMKIFFRRLDAHFLLGTLKRNELARRTLVYMATFKNYNDLKVEARTFSIEIFNDEVSVTILLFVGFEDEEYNKVSKKTNFHIVSFDESYVYMVEFDKIKNDIKYIDNEAWFYTLFNRYNNKLTNDFKTIKNFDLGKQ